MFGKKKEPVEKPKAWTKEWLKQELWSWTYIFLIVFGFRSTFIDHYHIPTGSLIPTNAIGDSIVVNKMSYGLKVPFSEYLGTISSWLGKTKSQRWEPIYITKQTLPSRGDIVVFEYPVDPSILFVKRTIGLPGDTIEVYDNELFLNGKKVQRTMVEDDEKHRELYDKEPYCDPKDMVFFEQEIDGKKFVTGINSHPRFPHRDQQKVTVPEGHIFVMGDNRDYSSDSREWGFVPLKNIRGKAFTVWMSLVYPWSDKPFHFRPSRIGTML